MEAAKNPGSSNWLKKHLAVRKSSTYTKKPPTAPSRQHNRKYVLQRITR